MIKPFKDIIPDNFNISGMRYTVDYQPQQKGNTKYGMMNNPKCELVLYQKMDDTIINRNQLVQTFWHEVVHGILDNMGESELSGNEKFVCTFSSLLNEVMQSAECEIHNPEPTKEPWEE